MRVAIAIWQKLVSQLQQPQNFIIEVIEERTSSSKTRDYYLMPLSCQMINNKLVLLEPSGNMFELQKGQYIIHIFNCSGAVQNCSLVTHARRPVNAHTRYEKEFK